MFPTLARFFRRPTPVAPRRRPQVRRVLGFDELERRDLPSVTLQLDFSHDTSGFFSTSPTASAARSILQQAATTLSAKLNDTLTAITPGGANIWTAETFDPSNPNQVIDLTNLSVAANTIIVFAGGTTQLSAGTLGEGGPGGFPSASGSQTFLNSLLGRGQAGALLSTPTDFAPWGGSVTFDATDSHWNFSTSAPSGSQDDFLSVCEHELGHVLGLGTADSWFGLVSGHTFTGKIAEELFGSAVPTDADSGDGHWANNLKFAGQNAAMDPVLTQGTRTTFTALDFAGLEDLGWMIGPTPTLSGPTSSNEGAGVSFTAGVTDRPLANVTFAWSVSASNGQAIAPGTGTTFGFTPRDNGTYTVSLTATDADGNSTTITQQDIVSNVAPTVTSPGSQTANSNQSSSLNLGTFSDPGTSDAPWSVDVNWGDNSTDTTFTTSSLGSLGTKTHTYTSNGNFTVTVQVTDKDGSAGQTTFGVTVSSLSGLLALSSPVPTGAGGTFSLTVTAQDGSGNTLTGYTGKVTLTSDDLQVSNPLATHTFVASDGGSFTFTNLILKSAGTRTLSASDGTLNGTGAITINPAAAASVVVGGGSSQGATVGAAYGTSLQAKVTDAFGNAEAAGINVTFTILANSLGAKATFAGGGTTATVATNSSGIAVAPTLTAGTGIGTFVVNASASGVATPAVYSLTNTPAGLPFTDTFAPSQSALTAASWQVLGGFFSQSGTSAVAGSSPNNFAVYRNGSSADMSVVAQNVSVLGGGTVGLIARLTGPTGYLATLNNAGGSGVVTLFELTPTAFVQLTSVNVATFTQPVTLRFDVVGISLRVFINNVLTASILNTAVSGPGQAGIYGTPGEALGTFTAAAAIPALPFGDGFTPNQPALTLTTWQPLQGSFSQTNGRAVAGSGANNYAVDVNASAADVSVSAQNVSVIGGGTVGLLARLVAPGGYLATLNNSGSSGVVTLFEVTPAAYVKLTSVNVAPFTQPVTLRFDVIGNSLQVFVNGNLDVSFLNSDLTGPGLAGIYGTAGESLGNLSLTAAVPTLPFADNFSPSQGTLTAANWQVQNGGFSQNGSQAVASSASLNIATYRNASEANVSLTDQTISVVNGGTVGLIARFSSPTSYYLAAISNSGSNGVVTIFQATASGFQVLASATVAPFTAPVTLTFNVVGNSLQVFVNGTLDASVLNSALTGPGLVGLWGTPNEVFGTFNAAVL